MLVYVQLTALVTLEFVIICTTAKAEITLNMVLKLIV